MRSKYKRRNKTDKIDTIEKKSQIIKNNINNSNASDTKKIKDKKIENIIFERTKPIINRIEKINYLKEKTKERFKNEENYNEKEKNKSTLNNINNKENRNSYKKVNIITNKDDKKFLQDNNMKDDNTSNLMLFRQRNNNSYKYNKITNDKIYNKEIIKSSSQNNQEINHKRNDIKKNEIIENNNNNIKYIYQKAKQVKISKENDNKLNNLNINTKRNYLHSQTESSLKLNEQNNYESKKLNKENNNLNRASSLMEMKTKYINNELKPKQSFKYLVHQATKSRDISNSFHKYYETRKLRDRQQSIESNMKDNTLKSEENSIPKYRYRNLNILKAFNIKNNDSASSINTITKENKYNSLTDRKDEISFDKNKLNNVKIFNFKYNINPNENKIIEHNINQETDNEKKENIPKIINNNIYNTTLNFYKIENNNKTKYFQKSRHFSANNIMENDDIIYEDERNVIRNYNKININNINNVNKKKKHIEENFISSSGTKSNIIHINLDNIISLEKIFKLLLEKINKYQTCEKECLEYILYFFNNKFYDEKTKAFSLKHTKKNLLENIKIELLCFFLCYDILFSKNFNQTAILFKTIFNLIHTNFLILISYIINNNQTNSNQNNQKHLENLQLIIEQDLTIKLNKKDMNEYNILQLINNNSKNINNYYKMIIDNLYGQYYPNDDNDIRFPQCLNGKNKNFFINLSDDELLNVKSAFFFDAYRLLTNYNFDDLLNFFNLVLKRKVGVFKKQSIEKINNNNCSNYKLQEKTRINIETKLVKYLLPKIKNNYKYSLVLDLDETLICIKRDNNSRVKLSQTNNLITLILRPGLLDFLQKMKKIYELILFSLGTSEYVSPIIKNIEKKEKFFEHILYREHVTYDDNGYFFKNLNLLNRDVKNIIIVDDNYKNFKYHKSNGICIKPFYGDSINDKNTLKILGNILFKIRYDADLTGDIRISLNKEKNSISYSQIANNI